jgi:hypothetical protein
LEWHRNNVFRRVATKRRGRTAYAAAGRVMATSPKLEKLYQLLRDRALAGKSFTMQEAIEFTGYMPSAIKTNFSKHLKGVWVSAVDDKHFRVHDFANVSLSAFVDAMSQNTRFSFEDEHQWRSRLRKLLALGIQHGHPVANAVADLLAELRVRRK